MSRRFVRLAAAATTTGVLHLAGTAIGEGYSVDHPPLGAYRPLVAFARCMRGHGGPMADPTVWRGHHRLSVHYPPHDRKTDAAYVACDRYKVLAKQRGGRH
jgi:hypothetical protein